MREFPSMQIKKGRKPKPGTEVTIISTIGAGDRIG